MGLATIIALLAFLIAMVALWLTSDVVKKVEHQNEKFVRAHINTIREEMREMDKSLRTVITSVKEVADQQGGLDSRLNDHTKDLDAIKARFVQLIQEMESLDRSIPARYRTQVVAKDDKGKAKPSLQ